MRQIGTFEKHVGGAELNVAVALARLGHRASWAGKLGEDEFGAEILAFARGEGVDVSGSSLDPDSPTGIYFKERRALDKLRVYYYRSGSAASKMRFEELDRLLSAGVLHLTGITPALSENCRELTERLMDEAFDARVRYTGMSLGLTIGTLLGAAFVSIIFTQLLATFGSYWPISVYLIMVGVISAVAVALLRTSVPGKSEEHEEAARAAETVV